MEEMELDALDELRMDIEQTPPGPEREELECTLAVCRELKYAAEEGIVLVTEDDDGEIWFHDGKTQCPDAPPVEA